MDSGMIGKIEKAKRYAEERDRIHFNEFTVTFEGANSSHSVQYASQSWDCDCDYFARHSVCSHSMALERILEGMIPTPAEMS